MQSNTNPTSSSECVRLNREGVQAMSCMDYKSAIKAFSGSLANLKEILGGFDKEESGTETNAMDDDASDLVFQFVRISEEDHGDDVEMGQNDQEPFIFKIPLSVHSLQALLENCNFASLARFSYSLLFNLALSYHLWGLADANAAASSSSKLKKALKFYELAYGMMKDCNDDCIMEIMVIVNNLGMVQSALGDKLKAKQCYEHLLSIIMFVQDAGQQDQVQDLEGFMHNVQTMFLHNTLPAQAA